MANRPPHPHNFPMDSNIRKFYTGNIQSAKSWLVCNLHTKKQHLHLDKPLCKLSKFAQCPYFAKFIAGHNKEQGVCPQALEIFLSYVSRFWNFIRHCLCPFRHSFLATRTRNFCLKWKLFLGSWILCLMLHSLLFLYFCRNTAYAQSWQQATLTQCNPSFPCNCH